MIIKKLKKVGKIFKPYYSQNNEQVLSTTLGMLRKKIEKDVGGKEPYDTYRMIKDQSERIDVLEAIIKKIDPQCNLDPILDIGDATEVYQKVNSRMKKIAKILKEVKES